MSTKTRTHTSKFMLDGSIEEIVSRFDVKIIFSSEKYDGVY